MKTVMIAAASAAVLAAGAAHAQDRNGSWYVMGEGGGAFGAKLDGARGPRSDSGWTGGIAVGREFGPLRLEAEGVYLDNSVKNNGGRIKTAAGFLNAYYDFLPGSQWRPFVGAGGGLAQVKLDGVVPVSGDDAGFAYQFKVGVAHPFSERLTGELAYRYLGVTKVSIDGDPFRGGRDYTTSAVTVGLRYRFGR